MRSLADVLSSAFFVHGGSSIDPVLTGVFVAPRAFTSVVPGTSEWPRFPAPSDWLRRLGDQRSGGVSEILWSF